MSIKGNDGIKIGVFDGIVFTTVSGEGQPVLFQIFLICSCCIFIGEYFGRKAKNS
jgi:hypothetical protein